MSRTWSNKNLLRLSVFSVVAYLLIFQSAWQRLPDYPQGVLKTDFHPVGIFRLAPWPISEELINWFFYLWPVFLVGALIPRLTRLCLLISFGLGVYCLGYSYNFGRVFHGTSLILQVLLVFALGIPWRSAAPKVQEVQAYNTLRIAQLLICLCYFAAGLSKVLKSGWQWAFTENLATILHTQALHTPFRDSLLNLPSGFLMTLSAFVFFIEITSLVPWFFRRAVGFYLFSWVLFHVGVHYSFGGHTTFFSLLFLLPVFWAKRPST